MALKPTTRKLLRTAKERRKKTAKTVKLLSRGIPPAVKKTNIRQLKAGLRAIQAKELRK